jgi:uncharacterized damage-inducible protein DinB
MGHALHDLVRHNIWATGQILDFCRNADEATLNATVPGTYGSILVTLRHMINSEASYLYRLTGARPSHPWSGEETVGVDVLAERAAILANAWERFLASYEVDTERLGEARGGDGKVFAVRAGIFITQALHHANEHRAQICTIIGACGFEAPDVSAWDYALTKGRSWVTSD